METRSSLRLCGETGKKQRRNDELDGVGMCHSRKEKVKLGRWTLQVENDIQGLEI